MNHLLTFGDTIMLKYHLLPTIFDTILVENGIKHEPRVQPRRSKRRKKPKPPATWRQPAPCSVCMALHGTWLDGEATKVLGWEVTTGINMHQLIMTGYRLVDNISQLSKNNDGYRLVVWLRRIFPPQYLEWLFGEYFSQWLKPATKKTCWMISTTMVVICCYSFTLLKWTIRVQTKNIYAVFIDIRIW